MMTCGSEIKFQCLFSFCVMPSKFLLLLCSLFLKKMYLFIFFHPTHVGSVWSQTNDCNTIIELLFAFDLTPEHINLGPFEEKQTSGMKNYAFWETGYPVPPLRKKV